MKKILFAMTCCLMLSGCDGRNDMSPNNENLVEGDGGFYGADIYLKTLTLGEGEYRETHQYVYFSLVKQGSLSHWAGCKYCKEKNTNTKFAD